MRAGEQGRTAATGTEEAPGNRRGRYRGRPGTAVAAAAILTLLGGSAAAAWAPGSPGAGHRLTADPAADTSDARPATSRPGPPPAPAPATTGAAPAPARPVLGTRPQPAAATRVAGARPAAAGGPASRRLPPARPTVRVRTPDAVVTAPRPVPARAWDRIRHLAGVDALTVVDAGSVRLHRSSAVVYGVDPATFRGFTPAPSARSDTLWRAVRRGELAASFDMAKELRLPLGRPVRVHAGAADVPVRVGAFASTGLPGVDAVVDRSRSAGLHLLPSSAAVLAAPHADPVRLRSAIRAVLGAGAGVDLLHRVVRVGDPGALLPSGTVARALAAAATRLGMPYRWGATGPDAFDCSGLVGWAYRQAGVGLPRTAAQLWYAGPHVAYADARPGDLLFWAYDPTAPTFIDHVALYVGRGMMIVAPHTGDVVSLRPVPMGHFMGAVRVAGTGGGLLGLTG